MIKVDDARERLAALIGEATRGADVIIAREDGAAVRLVPVQPPVQPRFGSARGLLAMSDDFEDSLSDFGSYER